MSAVTINRSELARTLREIGADAWLLFDFHGINPVTNRVLGITGGMATRRLFVLLPGEGDFVAVAHKIELQPVEGFPGKVVPYARWEELHEALAPLVAGRTLAMEISPMDAVPYLDRVPYGVVELVTKLGGTVVSSAPLVTRFAACWQPSEVEDHTFAAEVIARVAQDALRKAVASINEGLTESAMQAEVIRAMEAGGLELDALPIVAFGANTASPHYEPIAGRDATLREGDPILLDLWGGRTKTSVFADQTWMGYAGTHPPERLQLIWHTVREARDQGIAAVEGAVAEGRSLAGYEVDQAVRSVIDAAGFGAAFVHRTGHSIDRELHGSGPHLDSYETLDDRHLMPGVGFSIEPGIYLPGEVGVRSEVNMYWALTGPIVTPASPQTELITRAS
jgi:Xaa-Pro aminopeptidase